METLTIKKGQSNKAIMELITAWVLKRQKNGLDARRFSGVVKLKEDPMEIQRVLRDEWD